MLGFVYSVTVFCSELTSFLNSSMRLSILIWSIGDSVLSWTWPWKSGGNIELLRAGISARISTVGGGVVAVSPSRLFKWCWRPSSIRDRETPAWIMQKNTRLANIEVVAFMIRIIKLMSMINFPIDLMSYSLEILDISSSLRCWRSILIVTVVPFKYTAS